MHSFQTHRTIKTLSIIALGFVVFVGVGVMVTRLTVHDLVDVSIYKCGDPKAFLYNDNFIIHTALWLGEVRVLSVSATSAEFEFFTIYHIPLGVLMGQHEMKVSMECFLPANKYKI